ncbi:hypothetical protein [Nocardioides antri]|uniref:Uncharacterized protein n=1 Tax=Nocardioides antri TaxID=2607659 RepID=A0A5B1M2I3_9ACTN|nr:hypothetical protein [Nocardioides antri]KAA1426931.1 hypothetical protein F0U47_11480 [Nocardioides antri]
MTTNIAVQPKSVLTLLCATPATDLRTLDVRSDVRFGTAQGAAAQAIGAKRVRMTATTTGMGHVGTEHIVFAAGYVPGSLTWSPPT